MIKVLIYGGRIGCGTEWEQEILFNEDATEEDINSTSDALSTDFMDYVLTGASDSFDFWYDWEILEGDWSNAEEV